MVKTAKGSYKITREYHSILNSLHVSSIGRRRIPKAFAALLCLVLFYQIVNGPCPRMDGDTHKATKNILLVGHELTQTGSVICLQSLYDGIKSHFNVDLIIVSFMSPETQIHANLTYKSIMDSSSVIDLKIYDTIVVNTVIGVSFIKRHVDLFGYSWLSKVIWWIHEIPTDESFVGNTGDALVIDDFFKRLLVSVGRIIFVSRECKSFWSKFLHEVRVVIHMGIS